MTRNEILESLDISCEIISSHISDLRFVPDGEIPAKIWEVAGCMAVGISPSHITEGGDELTPKRLKLDSFRPAPLGAIHSALFSNLEPESIAQSAVKSDDTVVNTRMQLQHFLDKGGGLSGGSEFPV